MDFFRTHRWVGGLGIAWVVVFLASVGGLQGEPPASDAPLSEVRDFFADHGGRYLLGDFLAGSAFVLLLIPFVVLLPRALAVVDSSWARLAGVGVAVLVAVGGTATSFLDAVAIGRGSAALDDGVLSALLLANSAGIALIGLPAALVAASIAGMLRAAAAAAPADRTGPAARATAVLGWIAAALLVAGAAFPIDDDPRGPLWTVRFAGFIAFALLILVTSIGVVGRRRAMPVTASNVDSRPGGAEF